MNFGVEIDTIWNSRFFENEGKTLTQSFQQNIPDAVLGSKSSNTNDTVRKDRISLLVIFQGSTLCLASEGYQDLRFVPRT